MKNECKEKVKVSIVRDDNSTTSMHSHKQRGKSEEREREHAQGLTPSNSEVSMRSWSFMERRSLSLIPDGASASAIRWVWSCSTGGAGSASSSAWKRSGDKL